MALMLDLKRTAVLAMDLQNDIVNATPGIGEKKVLANIRQVLDRARQQQVAVVHITVSFRGDYRDAPGASPLFQMVRQNGMLRAGTAGAEIHADVRPQEGEPVLNKTCVDPFLTTNLDQLLHNLDANTLVLMGLWTNFVVEATARHASDLGYRVIVVRECCASNSDENHTFALTQILPMVATVAVLDEVLPALA
ncbi:MAG: cysteine hydrolase [Deltaproteobacteria bacterium]|nr:cysteine hydrolase [Deltaproteobacteria bacterium]